MTMIPIRHRLHPMIHHSLTSAAAVPTARPGPEYPGGPDNPEGIVCCQFEDGTNQEMSYAQCDDAGGVYWYPAPCDQPLGCCQIPDGDGGILPPVHDPGTVHRPGGQLVPRALPR